MNNAAAGIVVDSGTSGTTGGVDTDVVATIVAEVDVATLVGGVARVGNRMLVMAVGAAGWAALLLLSPH